MRQGRASKDNNDGRKVEPIAKGVSPAGVSQIGSSLGNHGTEMGRILHGASEPMYEGRGFNAPRDRKVQIFNGGSQRRTD